MSCACRETQSIFRNPKILRYKLNPFSRRKKWYDWKTIYEDSFMPIVCKIIGHVPYFSGDKDCDEIACHRCHRWL